MKLPRDVSGHELARALSRFGYTLTRQTGSHHRGTEHHVTIPAHDPLRVGTLSQVLSDVSAYLQLDRESLVKALFG